MTRGVVTYDAEITGVSGAYRKKGIIMANIEHIQYVKAPVSKVYEALTTVHGLAEIWTQELTFTAQLGAVNEFNFGDETPTKMEVTELAPNKEWSGTVSIQTRNGSEPILALTSMKQAARHLSLFDIQTGGK